jgi:non-specific serine/threonine protein kinase
MLREGDARPFTRIGQILGTPAYMSPEQIQSGIAGPKSDLYALGCVLHEMLTGRKPFVAESPLAVIYLHAQAPIPRLPPSAQHLQPLLEALLAKQPAGRPASGEEIVARIDELMGLAAA